MLFMTHCIEKPTMAWGEVISEGAFLFSCPLKETLLAFKMWIQNTQAAGYNGLHTVYES